MTQPVVATRIRIRMIHSAVQHRTAAHRMTCAYAREQEQEQVESKANGVVGLIHALRTPRARHTDAHTKLTPTHWQIGCEATGNRANTNSKHTVGATAGTTDAERGRGRRVHT